jgi:mycothiol synthase
VGLGVIGWTYSVLGRHSAGMLPAGYSWRPASVDDAVTIQAFVADFDTKLLGYPDCTLDDIRDQLTEPGLTIGSDTWLVFAADGTLAGWAWIYPRGTGEYIDLDVLCGDSPVCDWLFDQTIARAVELARAGGHDPATLDLGLFRADAATAELAAARGFHHATTFHRMRIDHPADAVVSPVAPAGVTLRSGPGDESFRRAAYEVFETSFKDHFGFASRSFEAWHAVREAESVFDWSGLTLAYVDGDPVAILLTSDRFVEAENCGSVDRLGVLPAARGRGIAKYLLRTAFAADAKSGRAGTILHVDTNNATGALALYEGVGMRPILVIDKWCRTVS